MRQPCARHTRLNLYPALPTNIDERPRASRRRRRTKTSNLKVQPMDRDAEIAQINRELEILRDRYALYERMGRMLRVFFLALIPVVAIGALVLAIKFFLVDPLYGLFFVGGVLIVQRGNLLADCRLRHSLDRSGVAASPLCQSLHLHQRLSRLRFVFLSQATKRRRNDRAADRRSRTAPGRIGRRSVPYPNEMIARRSRAYSAPSLSSVRQARCWPPSTAITVPVTLLACAR